MRAPALAEALLERLARGIRGEVKLPEARLGQDFGGVRQGAPAVVVRSRAEEDVAHCFRVAAELGVPVGFRGAGHSCRGQSLCENGILVESFRDDTSIEWLAGGRFATDAASSWQRVEAALNAAGRAMPVLTDYQSLSVGGTLSVGGKGFHSVARGLQVDHVRRARLVLPDGRIVWCSPDAEPELFRFALAGLGQLGYLARVEIESVPWRWFTSLYVTAHDDLPALARDLAWTTTWTDAWPTQFNAVLYQGQVMAFWGVEHADAEEAGAQGRPSFLDALPPATEFQHRNYRAMTHEQTVEWLSAFPDHWKVWADYVLDYPGLVAFVDFLGALRAEGAFGDCLEVVHLLGVRREAGALPIAFAAAPPGGAGPCWSVGLYAMVPAGDLAALSRLRAAYARCLTRCVDLGGRPYLYGWAELDHALCRRLYGADWDRREALRRNIDPAGILRDSLTA
jgi:FAD/FMN-containing dehydrogenase